MNVVQERIIICGTNGTGKSTFANKLIDASLKASPNKKALAILPSDDEEIFKPYIEIELEDLKDVSQMEERKLKLYFDDKKTFIQVEKHFQNGMLVLDDARFYTGANDEYLRKVFIRSRQNNVHLLYICHGLSEIPPNLFSFATKLVLFNTVDSWKRLKQKLTNAERFEYFVDGVKQRANNHKEGCTYENGKCSCGASYFYKIIDLKRDLL